MTVRRLKREIEFMTSILTFHCTSTFLKEDHQTEAKQEAILNEIVNTHNAMIVKCNSFPKDKAKAHFKNLELEFQGAVNALAEKIKELEN